MRYLRQVFWFHDTPIFNVCSRNLSLEFLYLLIVLGYLSIVLGYLRMYIFFHLNGIQIHPSVFALFTWVRQIYRQNITIIWQVIGDPSKRQGGSYTVRTSACAIP